MAAAETGEAAAPEETTVEALAQAALETEETTAQLAVEASSEACGAAATEQAATEASPPQETEEAAPEASPPPAAEEATTEASPPLADEPEVEVPVQTVEAAGDPSGTSGEVEAPVVQDGVAEDAASETIPSGAPEAGETPSEREASVDAAGTEVEPDASEMVGTSLAADGSSEASLVAAATERTEPDARQAPGEIQAADEPSQEAAGSAVAEPAQLEAPAAEASSSAAEAAEPPDAAVSSSAGTIKPGSMLASAVVPVSEHRRIWRPRRSKCPDETDADSSWYKHKRHVIIFTYSGKPVYTRYGCEEGISGTTGALSAIVSKFAAFFFGNQGKQDTLRYMIAGEHIFAFLEKGPLWLVCVSSCSDTYQDCVRLLDRVYLQVITILTNTLERTLQTHPNYDARNLLAGTDSVVNSMVRWCTQDMYLQVDGFEALPLAPSFRAIAIDALKAARINNVLVGFLMAGHRVLSVVSSRQYRLHALDLIAVINLIMSSASLRTVESWTPVCLPHLSDKAFAYAYISFVEESDVGIVFLSQSSEGEQFYAISQHASRIKKTLKTSGCLDAVQQAVASCPINLGSTTNEEAGRADRGSRKPLLAPFPAAQAKLLDGIIHAAYFVPSSQQFFSSAIALPYRSRRRTKMLFRSYGRCRLLLKNAKLPSQICIATDHECFYVSLAAEFQIYLTVPRGISTGVIGLFWQWVKAQEAHLFLEGKLPVW